MEVEPDFESDSSVVGLIVTQDLLSGMREMHATSLSTCRTLHNDVERWNDGGRSTNIGRLLGLEFKGGSVYVAKQGDIRIIGGGMTNAYIYTKYICGIPAHGTDAVSLSHEL